MDLKPGLVLVTGLFAVTILAGALALPAFFAETLEDVGELLEPLYDLNSILLVLLIFLNNAFKALLIIVLGAALGLAPLALIAYNGLLVGALVASTDVSGAVVAAALLPHGILEVPLILLSAALGVTAGWQSLKWIARRESKLGDELLRGLRVYARWIVPGLLIAALIEVYATPYVLKLAGG